MSRTIKWNTTRCRHTVLLLILHSISVRKKEYLKKHLPLQGSFGKETDFLLLVVSLLEVAAWYTFLYYKWNTTFQQYLWKHSLTNLPHVDLCIIFSLTFDHWVTSVYYVQKQKRCITHRVCEHLLMISKHVWPMLTELCLLLVLHAWKATSGSDNTQAARAIKATVNVFQDVGMVEQTAKAFYSCTAGWMKNNETFEVSHLKSEKVAALQQWINSMHTEVGGSKQVTIAWKWHFTCKPVQRTGVLWFFFLYLPTKYVQFRVNRRPEKNRKVLNYEPLTGLLSVPNILLNLRFD